MELIEILEKESPLEQRAVQLERQKDPQNKKLNSIVSAGIGFYEKLYLIYKVFGSEKCKDAANFVSQRLFSQMSIGEIVSELLKPHLVEIGMDVYPDIDFSILFSDPRYNLEYSFIQSIRSEYDDFWQALEKKAEEAISEKYDAGLKHFAEVVSRMGAEQPFLKSNPLLVFQTTNEGDYILNLIEWAKDHNYFGLSLPQDLEEFIASLGPAKKKKRGKKRTHRDNMPKIDAMTENRVTIFGMEYEGARQNPVLMTFRAKSLRSARAKVSLVYSGLMAFHGEGIYQRAISELPFLLEDLIKKEQNKGRTAKRIIDFNNELWNRVYGSIGEQRPMWLTKGKKRDAWLRYNDHWHEEWSNLQQHPSIRSGIVGLLGNYGSIIEKYTTWQDVIEVFGDLFAMTLAYPLEDFLEIAESQIINPVCSNEAAGIFRDTSGSSSDVDYIFRQGYNAIHFYIVASQEEHPVEVHITNITNLMINDAVGEGNHMLYQQRKVRELMSAASAVRPILERIAEIVGQKQGRETRGYLSPIKRRFSNFAGYLRERGIPAQDYIKPASP